MTFKTTVSFFAFIFISTTMIGQMGALKVHCVERKSGEQEDIHNKFITTNTEIDMDSVSITISSRDTLAGLGITNHTGHAAIANIPEGYWDIQAVKTGYEDYIMIGVHIYIDKITYITLAMHPKQTPSPALKQLIQTNRSLTK